jgi:hypothetical protein
LYGVSFSGTSTAGLEAREIARNERFHVIEVFECAESNIVAFDVWCRKRRGASSSVRLERMRTASEMWGIDVACSCLAGHIR